MKTDEALLLAYLLNTWKTVKADDRHEGWFYCRMSKIHADLHFSVNKQTELIKRMQNKYLLETEMRGFPAARWIRFKWDAMWDLLKRSMEAGIEEEPE
jgi:uncharacterized protein YndB with AHSA1/START domain